MSRIHKTNRIVYAFRSKFFLISFCSSFSTIRNIISLPLLVKSSFLTNDVRERGSRDESAKNVKAEGLERYQINFTVILYRKPLYI